ncbi:MAG: glycoside hydrolase family 9 protein [Sphingomonas sp.]
MRKRTMIALLTTACAVTAAHAADDRGLTVTPAQTLEEQGLTVVIDQNQFSPIFFDEKNGGIQMILHGRRIAADGDVRLNPTPEQWNPVPAFVDRTLGSAPNQVVVHSAYKDAGLDYHVKVTAEPGGYRIAVDLAQPLPASLAGKAGFNMDFLPTAYFGKTYYLDGAPGLFPRDANGVMATDGSGDPQPLASGGKSITLSPEDPETRVTITSDAGPLALYDARNRAQNGWFVVRSLIRPGATTDAVVWHVRPHVIKDWVRQPVVSYDQAGYTPDRSKVAVIELDPHFTAPAEATLVKLGADGTEQPVLTQKIKPWGKWLRYDYATFDFSGVRDPGLYAISYAGHTTHPFRISPDAYDHIWQTSLDTYLAEQMDHMRVREQYRIWQGTSHLDDARQAPPNIVHFDGYHMGPNLDSPFKAGEHIPGLNVGGWQDAGDYDIQTPSNAFVIRDLVWGRELFGLNWDETTIDEPARYVQIRKPDGVQDSLQQIRHGTMQLLAQYKAFGHAIVGIVSPTLEQYTHLGDAASQTDGKVYDPKLGKLETSGDASGKPDDRWAFTTDLPANDLVVAGALAGASRVLNDSDPQMAADALRVAKALWQAQRAKVASGGEADDGRGSREMLPVSDAAATIELLITTKGDPVYRDRLKQLLPVIAQHFEWIGGAAVRAIPYMGADYRAQLIPAVKAFKARVDDDIAKNPFGVPVAMGSWAGSNQVATFGSNMYLLHKAFPEIVDTHYTLDALDYMLGRHPANNLSLVSTVGTDSKLIGYGHNRADYSFVAGGMTPGVIIIKPDFPELKTQWPFLWFENEYTVSTTSSYILAANAAIAATSEKQ